MKIICERLFVQNADSHNIDLVPKRNTANMITAILSWLFSSYAVSAENVYKCGNCGYESNALPEPLNTEYRDFEPENLN